MESPYRSVFNKGFTKLELSNWNTDSWLNFIKFADLFLTRDTKGEERYLVNKERVELAEKCFDEPNHPWQEYLCRIHQFSFDKPPKAFFLRLKVMIRTCLTYLKVNPSLVNDEMKSILEKYPKRLGWCLEQYYLRDTGRGVVVQRDTTTVDGGIQTTTTMPSVEKKQMETLIEMIDLHQQLVRSIKRNDLHQLDVKDKLIALPRLVDAITKMTNRKVSNNSFTQINIHGSAKEMEAAALDYIKQKNAD